MKTGSKRLSWKAAVHGNKKERCVHVNIEEHVVHGDMKGRVVHVHSHVS